MNEIKQTLQQDADALLKRLQQSRKNGTGVTLGVSDVGVLCEVLGGGGWISVDDRLPEDGQKCLVVFESSCLGEESHRFIGIDTFDDCEFGLIINHNDVSDNVSFPSGTLISKLRAAYWCPTRLSNKPLEFDDQGAEP